MAEIEIHHGHGHEDDAFGKKVGVTVGVIGIVLAVITISSHRAHTAAVIHRTEANDQWSFYQSKKIREQAADIASTVLTLLATDVNKAAPAITKLKEIQNEAKAKEHETEHAELQALRFDLGEGLLELGLVLSSLYFMAKRRVFPVIGITAAVVGAVIGISGFLV